MGCFVNLDVNNFKGLWKTCSRVRVDVDIRQPLNRHMKLKKATGEWVWVDFRYERLPFFSFLCGCLSLTDRKCGRLYESSTGDVQGLIVFG